MRNWARYLDINKATYKHRYYVHIHLHIHVHLYTHIHIRSYVHTHIWNSNLYIAMHSTKQFSPKKTENENLCWMHDRIYCVRDKSIFIGFCNCVQFAVEMGVHSVAHPHNNYNYITCINCKYLFSKQPSYLCVLCCCCSRFCRPPFWLVARSGVSLTEIAQILNCIAVIVNWLERLKSNPHILAMWNVLLCVRLRLCALSDYHRHFVIYV